MPRKKQRSTHKPTFTVCINDIPRSVVFFFVFLMIKSRKNNHSTHSTIIYQWSLHQQGSSGEIFGTASHQLKPSHVALKVSLAAHSSSGLPPVPVGFPPLNGWMKHFNRWMKIPWTEPLTYPKLLNPNQWMWWLANHLPTMAAHNLLAIYKSCIIYTSMYQPFQILRSVFSR